ncbi:MAG: hypothetical protein NT001_05040 [Candidatus Woesearchaeota archaeon]|nr:hypothetical protein [Candidatus Woesearchaeota archaeon]
MNKKSQVELAIIKGLAIAFVIITGFYIYERISGQTNEGQKIDCEWSCENIKWSECTSGFQYRDIGICSYAGDCKCVPNDVGCFQSNAKPITKKSC